MQVLPLPTYKKFAFCIINSYPILSSESCPFLCINLLANLRKSPNPTKDTFQPPTFGTFAFVYPFQKISGKLTLNRNMPMSSTIPLPPREQLCNRYCSNKHTHSSTRYYSKKDTHTLSPREQFCNTAVTNTRFRILFLRLPGKIRIKRPFLKFIGIVRQSEGLLVSFV